MIYSLFFFGMRRSCKNCSRRKNNKSAQNKYTYSAEQFLQTDFGLVKVISPAKVLIHDDEYMLHEVKATSKKVNKLEKYSSA